MRAFVYGAGLALSVGIAVGSALFKLSGLATFSVGMIAAVVYTALILVPWMATR